MFNFISTVISTSFKATVCVSAAVVGFTYLTKPTDQSFSAAVSRDAPLGTQTVAKVFLSNIAEIDDYVCFKLAKFPSENGNRIQYIGIVNQWIPLKK